MTELYSPWVLLLLLVLPLLVWLMVRTKRQPAVKFSSLAGVKGYGLSWRQRMRPLLIVLRVVCVAALIFALARPRKGTMISHISTEGVAIEMVVDRSGSMQTEMSYGSETLNRLEVVKRVFADFVKGNNKEFKGRGSDMVGLVTFARYPDTVCPLVQNHEVLTQFLKKTSVARLQSEDGTAIGDAVSLAAARLYKAEDELKRRNASLVGDAKNQEPEFTIKSKIMVLLTDGNNNFGKYDPMEAAALAKKWGIKIYAVGVGGGQAFVTMQTPMGTYKMPAMGQELDERLLKAMADATGGFYARAQDADALKDICRKIDDLEKTKVTSVQYTQYAERFSIWAWVALAALAAEILASCTIFRKIP
jgi:Ca-activated chloride channel family protein